MNMNINLSRPKICLYMSSLTYTHGFTHLCKYYAVKIVWGVYFMILNQHYFYIVTHQFEF